MHELPQNLSEEDQLRLMQILLQSIDPSSKQYHLIKALRENLELRIKNAQYRAYFDALKKSRRAIRKQKAILRITRWHRQKRQLRIRDKALARIKETERAEREQRGAEKSCMQ